MNLREAVTIKARPETVWFFLDDPDLVRTWNPKVRHWEPLSDAPRGLGYTFGITFHMGGKDRPQRAEFTAYDPPHRLSWHLRDAGGDPRHETTLTFELKPHPKGTRLIQTLEIPDANMPVLGRWLVRLIHHIGRPQGERTLHTLKRLAEEMDR